MEENTFREVASQIELTIFDGLIIPASGQMINSTTNNDSNSNENSENDDDPMFKIVCYTQNPEGSILLKMKRSVLLSECPVLAMSHHEELEGRTASVRGLLYFEKEKDLAETSLSVDVRSIQLSTNPVPIPTQLRGRLGLQNQCPSSSNSKLTNDEKEVHQEENENQKEEEGVSQEEGVNQEKGVDQEKGVHEEEVVDQEKGAHQEEDVDQEKDVDQKVQQEEEKEHHQKEEDVHQEDGDATTENNQELLENFITPQEELPVTELNLNDDLSLVIEELEKSRDGEEMITEAMNNEIPIVPISAIYQQEVVLSDQVHPQGEIDESMTRESQLPKQQEENTVVSKSPADLMLEEEDRIVDEIMETKTTQALSGESNVEEPHKNDSSVLPAQESPAEQQQQQKYPPLIEEASDKDTSLVQNVEPSQEVVSLIQEEDLQQQQQKMTGLASSTANETQVQQSFEESFHSTTENLLVMQRTQDSPPYPQQEEPMSIDRNENITSAKEVLANTLFLTVPDLPDILQVVPPSQTEEQQVMNGTQDERDEGHTRKKQKSIHTDTQQEPQAAPIEQREPSSKRGRRRKKQKERFIGPIFLRRSPRLINKRRPQYFPPTRRKIRKRNQGKILSPSL